MLTVLLSLLLGNLDVICHNWIYNGEVVAPGNNQSTLHTV